MSSRVTSSRQLAMFIILVTSIAFWTTSIITIFYAAHHTGDFPNTQNPYYVIGLAGIIPSIISSFIGLLVWDDGIKESRGK